MLLLDQSDETPARHLAIDEALLACAERGESGEALRFWEGTSPFVVLGVSQRYQQETLYENCLRDGVPVLRRCSAGGCVLQGPGSLNFSLVLEIAREPDFAMIRRSYCYILGRICDALKQAGVDASLSGTSDIAVAGRKVSGNAQRRKRNYLLHHGTLLYSLDGLTISEYLAEPPDRPEYRGDRAHAEFVQALPIQPADLKDAIRAAFTTETVAGALPRVVDDCARELDSTKYSLDSWNLRR